MDVYWKLYLSLIVGLLGINLITALSQGGTNVCATQMSRSQKYATCCTFFCVFNCDAYRTVYYNDLYCCAGWVSAGGSDCRQAICDGKINPDACTRSYTNGEIIRVDGTPETQSGGSCVSPETCDNCNQGFYPSGAYCYVCTQITDCNLEECSSDADSTCIRCRGVVATQPGKRAYVLSADSRQCIQACSWKADSTFCYPGTCASEWAQNCACSTGHSGNLCKTIDDYPTVINNLITLEDSSGTTVETPSDSNSVSPQPTKYTNNVNVNKIKVYYEATYQFSGTLPASPAYITAFRTGMVDGNSVVTLERGGNSASIISPSILACNDPADNDSPNTGKYVCDSKPALMLPGSGPLSGGLQTNDKIKVELSVFNGGYVNVYDLETLITTKHYYTGKKTTLSYDFTIDLAKPYHCTSGSACLSTMMLAPEVTPTATFTLTWSNWMDDLSGIKEYTVDVTTLQLQGSVLTEVYPSVDFYTITSGSQQVTLTNAGPHSIVLAAHDNAGNFELTRRVVMYDAASSVTVRTGTYLRVTSTAATSNYLWQQNLNSVVVDWTDRYINTVHHSNKWLNAVGSYVDLKSEYDDQAGDRNTSAVDNVQGIVQFRTSWQKDHAGGSSFPVSPSTFDIYMDIHAQTQTIAAALADGDTFKFWIQAYDIMGVFDEESVMIHADSSAPLIEDLWLTREDRLDLAVHNVLELNEMTIEWVTYDIHSGIHEVYWRLYESFTSTDVLHGHENLVAQGGAATIAECETTYATTGRGPACYCTPMSGCFHKNFQLKPRILADSGLFPDKSSGTHDHDYYFSVRVTNKALLVTELVKKITIDTTSPHEGIVHDGIKGSPEVDYQTSMTLNAHWEGFFDRESGVKFYQYGFTADNCLTASDFSLTSTSTVYTEVTSTSATWTAPSAGTYYVTVVAYNTAMEPSTPVCSDGVTIDTTPPTIQEVYIANINTAGGLVKDGSDNIWFIQNNRYRFKIESPSTGCISKAALMNQELELFPIARLSNDTLHTLSDSVCLTQAAYSPPSAKVLTKASHIFVNWTAADTESNLHDFNVGISSTSSVLAPDISPFASSKQHTQYETYHPGIATGQTVYIVIQAINKAGLSTSRSIGPMIVDLSKPDFSGSLMLAYEDGFLVASWPSGGFSDAQSTELFYKFAVGQSSGGSEIHPFSNLLSGGSCTVVVPPSCTAISTDLLPWQLHGQHSYYVTLEVSNTGGLAIVVTSPPYVHDVTLPSMGIVLDVSPASEVVETFGVPDDVDFQVSTSSLSARWSGFAHPHLSMTYEVGVGTSPGTFDVVPRTVADSNNQHVEPDLTLPTMTTYYFTVVAISSAGSVNVSSDGISLVNVRSTTVLQEIVIKDGKDCNGYSYPHDSSIFTHHQNDTRRPCLDDVDYQASTSHLSAHWSVPSHLTGFVPEVYWAVELKSEIANIWFTVQDYQFMGSSFSTQVDGLSLSPGRTYRTAIKYCAGGVCYHPLYSNGVTIIPRPPKTGAMTVDYTPAGGTAKVTVTFTKFRDEDVLAFVAACSVMDWYEWTLTDASDRGRILRSWYRIDNLIELNSTAVKFTGTLPKELSFQACARVSVRGYTKASTYNVITADVKDCQAFDPQYIVPRIIVDAVGPPISGNDTQGSGITLEQNANWPLADADYTPYSNMLSAVWPSLRHRNYTWVAVLAVNLDALTHYIPSSELNAAVPSDMPGLIAFGSTDKEFINIPRPEELLHGMRYYVCVHADTTVINHEKWTEGLPEVSVCTDGVTVDLTPPTPGLVWIGPDDSTVYQSSQSEIFASWTSFVDVEEHEKAPHHSGISRYEFAIGTTAGGIDVQNFLDVGIANHAVAHGLRLQNGHAYYATIKAIDFVNRTTIVTSKPITVDNTPPEKFNKLIDVGGRHIMTSNIKICWTGVFLDAESGLNHYMWGVGSSRGHDDVIAFTYTDQECIETGATAIDLVEGHAYYVAVKGYNAVGLSSLATSWALVVDYSPPTSGHVYDGSGSLDVDYQTDVTSLSAHWDGFYEPHSTLTGFTVSVGSCAECADIMPEQYVGLDTAFTVDHLELSVGLIYYVTVTACNSADLCTVVTSDGIILDNSPPQMGHVMDGIDTDDIHFQASRYTIGAKWFGFTDAQSGLQRYEWRAGTTRGGDDVISATDLHVTEMAVIPVLPVGQELPLGDMIFITVRAYNGAGLFVESTSDGFLVDTSPPSVVTSPAATPTYGSAVDGTHAYRTTLRVQWEFKDDQSLIAQQFVSLSSHAGGEFESAATQIPSLARDYTFTGQEFHDGGYYTVTIIACNLAKLCSKETTQPILIDSSQPTPGMFAVQTAHAAALTRHEAGWMEWTELPSVKLAWLGFVDLHSGVNHYMVTIGSTYQGTDLTSTGEPVRVIHTTSGTDNQDEGHLQTTVINTQPLSADTSIYVAMWAVNAVGLDSIIIQSKFDLVSGGSLALVRRCTGHSCDGQCVCAPQNQRCSATGSCSDVILSNTNTLIEVYDVVNLRFQATPIDVDYSPSESSLAAEWKVSTVQGNSITRYEWSAGYSSGAAPSGIFSNAERTWFDAGQSMYAVLALPRGKSLEANVQYSFFVRVWYDTITYAVFKSDGVKVTILPPKPINVQGVVVKETTTASSDVDIDFTSINNAISAKWSNKFVGDIEKYDVTISTYPGGDDIYHHPVTVTADNLDITGLSLNPFITYFTNVMAYAYTGLHALESSDGIKVDTTKPFPGIVFDSLGPHDAEYQNASDVVSASWHGFHDIESAIVSYSWCVGLTGVPGECDVKAFENVGLHTSASRKLSTPVVTGSRIYNKVYAMNGAGLQSDTMISDGITVDTTKPDALGQIQFGSNFIANPSFESDSIGETLMSLNDISAIQVKCSAEFSPNSWNLGSDSCSVILRPLSPIAQNGQAFLLLYGSIQQTLSGLSIGKRYRVMFYSSHYVVSQYPTTNHEAILQIGEEKHILLLFPRSSRSDVVQTSNDLISWQKHASYFTATGTNILLKLGTISNRNGILLDDISVQELSSSFALDNHVSVHSVQVQDWSYVHAVWHFVDADSPIVDYKWAVGNVRGGTQLQRFMSVGRMTHASNTSISLTHNSYVHVTVIATNAAGLHSEVYSEQMLIDITPPVLAFVHDGFGADTETQDTNTISASWGVADPESGIDQCDWTVGLTAGGSQIQLFQSLPVDVRTASAEFNSSVIASQTVYVTIRCWNVAGLFVIRSSNGVYVVGASSVSKSAQVQGLPSSSTPYPSQPGCHSVHDTLRLHWTGFSDPAGIKAYQVLFEGGALSLIKDVSTPSSPFDFSDLQALELTNGKYYEAKVRSRNNLDVHSDYVQYNVSIQAEPPTVNASRAVSLSKTNTRFVASWSGLFSPEADLFYEVTVGTRRGAADILMWQETMSTEVAFLAPSSILDFPSQMIHFFITAVNQCGLSSGLPFEVNLADFYINSTITV